MTKVKNYLLGYKDMYIIQDTDMFNFSLDSVLLANFVKVDKKTKKILDIGCGNGPIPLILSTLSNADITGVEIQKEVFDLAIESIKINNLENRITIVNNDICNFYKNINTGIFDAITCNPPFFKYDETKKLNESEYKTIARHEIKLDLDRLFKVAKKLLKNDGVIAIVHRPERLADIIEKMRKNNLEAKKIKFIHPKYGKEANMVLVEGVKNGNPGIKILSPLISHNEDGSYSDEIKKYFEKGD